MGRVEDMAEVVLAPGVSLTVSVLPGWTWATIDPPECGPVVTFADRHGATDLPARRVRVRTCHLDGEHGFYVRGVMVRPDLSPITRGRDGAVVEKVLHLRQVLEVREGQAHGRALA